MILTGKAKEDFIEWYKRKYNTTFMTPLYENFHIIEWLDSVSFYIEIDLIHKEDNMKAFTFSLSFKDYFAYCDKEFSSREEVIERAIINANKLYNKIFG